MRALSDDASVVLDREPDLEKSREPSGHASAGRSASGRLAKKTMVLAPAGTNGTPSTREASALHACTSGVNPSASRAASGQRIPIGMRSDLSDDDPDMPVRSPAWKQSTN